MSNSLYEKYELECHLDTSRMNYTYFNVTWMWGKNSLVFQDSSDKLQSMRLPGYYITDIGINVSMPWKKYICCVRQDRRLHPISLSAKPKIIFLIFLVSLLAMTSWFS